MKHFILFYQTAPDYMERRGEFRGAHLGLAREFVARGEMVLGGALADPADGAVLVFKGEDKSVAERFANEDPYVKNGLIASWNVREWTTVVGEGALTKV
ncbi:MAG: YciI-like protein [Caulobacterales bacterium]|uniref:YciI-like protein n=1 Tax=Glycocaulis sp. TaxID=1969725 RepID=UPI003F9F2C77